MNKKCARCKIEFDNKYPKQKFCSILCSNRHNLNHKNIFKKPSRYSNELAELFGILLGDGSVEKYYVKIYLNMIADKGYTRNITRLITSALPGVKPSIHIRKERGTEEVQISCTDVCDYFKSLGFNPQKRIVPGWITENQTFTKRTLRGLFDTEGSIGIKRFVGKNNLHIYKQLTFTNKNKDILQFVVNSLSNLGFSPTKTSRYNIYISNRKDIERYFNLIGTSNPKLEKKMKIK
ncbi:hypothetical protein IT399_02150 [Candidatus Nomurabacteria bacterium]|nr:hypothetical protein [Candidatus Nomurabacteria bacterium]